MAYSITEPQGAELLNIAETIVGKHVKTGFIVDSDRKDYAQELMLIMVQHQSDWVIPDGVRFEAFANTVMKKRLFSIWRKRHSNKDVMMNTVSLNTVCRNDSGEEEEIINLLSENGAINNDADISACGKKDEYLEDLRLFVAALPDNERRLCELLMYHNKSKCSLMMKKHKQIIWRMIARIRKKMIEAGFGPCSQKKKKNSEKV